MPFRRTRGCAHGPKVDRVSGKRVFGGTPGERSWPKASLIWEAFKPDSEPKRTARKGEVNWPSRR